jgi:hypothetical protein
MNSYEEKYAQSRRKSTVLHQLCALLKTGARLFAQIKACAVHKHMRCAARKTTLTSHKWVPNRPKSLIRLLVSECYTRSTLFQRRPQVNKMTIGYMPRGWALEVPGRNGQFLLTLRLQAPFEHSEYKA